MIAVLDTNLLVSAFILKRGIPHDILAAWRADQFRVVTSKLLVDEIDEVLRRPKFARSYSASAGEIADYLSFVRSRSRLVSPATTEMPAVRDPDDELLLRVAAGGNADFLVTGDNDLLALEGDALLSTVQIVTPRHFLTILLASRSNETT